MNEDEKKVPGADDGLAALLNTFGGYNENLSNDDSNTSVVSSETPDDIDTVVSADKGASETESLVKDDIVIGISEDVPEEVRGTLGGLIDFSGVISEDGPGEVSAEDETVPEPAVLTDDSVAEYESADETLAETVDETVDETVEVVLSTDDISVDEYTYEEPETSAVQPSKKNKKKRKNKNKNKAVTDTSDDAVFDDSESVSDEVPADAEPVATVAAEEIPVVDEVVSSEEVGTGEVSAPEAKHVKKKKNKKKKTPPIVAEDEPEEEVKPASPARLVTVLAAICAAVALLLGAVNFFTEPIIAANSDAAMLTSIRDIFDKNVTVEAVTVPEGADLSGLYIVMKNGGVCGYSAAVAPSGFGGPINMMVGVDSEGKIVGVKIVSMSETPGLGSKVGGESFLEQFNGADGSLSFGNGADAISGATISSTAVLKGINSILSFEIDLETLAAERGLEVIPFVYDEAVTTETTVSTTETVTDADATTIVTDAATDTEAVTEESLPTPPEVDKGNTPPDIIVDNPNNETPDFDVEYEEGDTEYETITTEPESDLTEEIEDTEEITEEVTTTTVTTTTETTTVETTTEETTVTTITTTLPETESPTETTTVTEDTEPETVATETEAPADTAEE